MKKYTKDIVLVLITVIVVSVVSVSAAVHFNSANITFIPDNSSWNVSNTNDALNDLYDTSNRLINFKTTIAQAITNKGVETLPTDSAETMASNIENISTSNGLDISEIESYGYINTVENLFRHGSITKTVSLTNTTEILCVTVWNEGSIPTVSVNSDQAEVSLLDTAIYTSYKKTYVYLIKGKIGQSYTYIIDKSGGNDSGHRMAYYGNYSSITKVLSINSYGSEWTITLPYDGKYILMCGGIDGTSRLHTYNMDGAIKVTEGSGTDKAWPNNSAVFYIEGYKGQSLTLTLNPGGLGTTGTLLYIN
ncbi:MAG: hypothetical protein ACI31M_01150 [Bacilli bacterium]